MFSRLLLLAVFLLPACGTPKKVAYKYQGNRPAYFKDARHPEVK